jgi:hypothetical protein
LAVHTFITPVPETCKRNLTGLWERGYFHCRFHEYRRFRGGQRNQGRRQVGRFGLQRPGWAEGAPARFPNSGRPATHSESALVRFETTLNSKTNRFGDKTVRRGVSRSFSGGTREASDLVPDSTRRWTDLCLEPYSVHTPRLALSRPSWRGLRLCDRCRLLLGLPDWTASWRRWREQ